MVPRGNADTDAPTSSDWNMHRSLWERENRIVNFTSNPVNPVKRVIKSMSYFKASFGELYPK